MNANLREFLGWVDDRPRTYAEAMEAWASHCPRFTPWEDSQIDGLVRLIERDGAVSVVLTRSGRQALRAARV